MVNRLWWSRSTILFIYCLPYEWQLGTSDGLFLPIYPPRSMRLMLLFLMTSQFLQQVYEFFLTNVSPWTYAHSSFYFASLYYYRATSAGIINPLFTSLKTATIPTYYGISIAIPRYIAMQLSTVPFIWHALLVIFLFAWSCSWHCICGKATFIIFIHVALDSLHILVHRRRHSYRVIS